MPNCILGCPRGSASLHRFPKALLPLKNWVRAIGGDAKLATVEHFKKKFICDDHFLTEHKTRNNRLSAIAVPALGVPESALEEFPTVDHIIEFKGDEDVSCDEYVMEYNEDEPPEVEYLSPDNITLDAMTIYSTETVVSSSNENDYVMEENNATVPQFSTFEPTIREAPIFEGSTYELPTPGTLQNFSDVIQKEHCYSQLTSRSDPYKSKHANEVKTMKRQLMQMNKIVKKLRRENRSFKKRLEEAEKNRMGDIDKITEKMTSAGRIFTKLQMKSDIKARGRRYSTEEKFLSLSLFKRSPESYDLLSQLFTLPSSISLKKLLSRIENTAGTSHSIFESNTFSLEQCSILDKSPVANKAIGQQVSQDIVPPISYSVSIPTSYR